MHRSINACSTQTLLTQYENLGQSANELRTLPWNCALRLRKCVPCLSETLLSLMNSARNMLSWVFRNSPLNQARRWLLPGEPQQMRAESQPEHQMGAQPAPKKDFNLTMVPLNCSMVSLVFYAPNLLISDSCIHWLQESTTKASHQTIAQLFVKIKTTAEITRRSS